MPTYYYGTVPVLAWIINHYFYGGLHYTWLAEQFHPLRTNPKSSNPYLIYGDLYWPWAWDDPYDKFVKETRRTLQWVVGEQERRGMLDNITAARLRPVCSNGGVELFYPITYRVPMVPSVAARGVRAGSGLEGSHEVLIPDLRETEFDLLFADNGADPLFRQLVQEETTGTGRTAPADALARLEERIVQ